MKTAKSFFFLGLVFFLSAASLTSCKKYEDGPMLSLRSKKHRVVNDWKLDRYFINDTDKTDSLGISNYTESFLNDGSVLRSFISLSGDTISDTCTWSFGDKKETLEIAGADSLELSEQFGYLTLSNLRVLRLKEHELWYSVEKNGTIHEFHLTEK